MTPKEIEAKFHTDVTVDGYKINGVFHDIDRKCLFGMLKETPNGHGVGFYVFWNYEGKYISALGATLTPTNLKLREPAATSYDESTPFICLPSDGLGLSPLGKARAAELMRKTVGDWAKHSIDPAKTPRVDGLYPHQRQIMDALKNPKYKRVIMVSNPAPGFEEWTKKFFGGIAKAYGIPYFLLTRDTSYYDKLHPTGIGLPQVVNASLRANSHAMRKAPSGFAKWNHAVSVLEMNWRYILPELQAVPFVRKTFEECYDVYLERPAAGSRKRAPLPPKKNPITVNITMDTAPLQAALKKYMDQQPIFRDMPPEPPKIQPARAILAVKYLDGRFGPVGEVGKAKALKRLYDFIEQHHGIKG